MQKMKFDFSKLGMFIKIALAGIISTLVGILIFSFILKFVDMSSTVISYINDVIKALSIFIMVLILKKLDGERLLIKSIIASLLYAILCFIVFSILNGSFAINMSLVFDLFFAIAVSVIATIIVNTLKRKTLW